MSWQVALLMDADTNVNVGVGLMPIWALTTEQRLAYAPEWRKSWNSMWHPEPGFTLVNTPLDDDHVSWVASLIPTIQEHHPNLFCLHLFGVNRSDRLVDAMAELGYFPATINIDKGLSFNRSHELIAKELALDASGWSLRSAWFWLEDFYSAFFHAVGSPEWHGRNFDALNDSIASGGINEIEVPYEIVIHNARNENEMVRAVLDELAGFFLHLRSQGCPVAFRIAK
jgi:RNAse (barnase) inhibitor barstar